MVTQWVPMMMTTPLVGMTSDPGLRFSFPRFYCIQISCFTCINIRNHIKLELCGSTGILGENY
jgi:hypothetical protein